MSNITYHVLLFTTANVRETDHDLPSWTCKKVHECKLISTYDVGGMYHAVPVRRLIKSYEACTCRAGVYSSTCEWKFFGSKEWRNEMSTVRGISVQYCEDTCNNGPKGLELDSNEDCSWGRKGDTRSVRGVEVSVVSDPFEFGKFIKQTQGKNYDLKRADHTVYRNIVYVDELLHAMADDAKYSVNRESFRGLNYIWIENECEVELSSGDGWILTPKNLYFSRALNRLSIKRILNFKMGEISEGFIRSMVFDSTNELQKACASYSPERLCEKMAGRVDAYNTNKIFGFNLLVTKAKERQEIFECKMEKKTLDDWKWMTDHYYTTVNQSEVFKVVNAQISELQLPTAVRWNENYYSYIITSDERSKDWTRKDVENNITVMMPEDPYRVENNKFSVEGILRELGGRMVAFSKETVIRVALIVMGLWLVVVLARRMVEGLAINICHPGSNKNRQEMIVTSSA